MPLRPLVLSRPSEDGGCADPTHMHEACEERDESSQPREGLLGQVIGAPLALKNFDVSVVRSSVGRASFWKWGKEGACEAFRKAIYSFAGCEGVGPL